MFLWWFVGSALAAAPAHVDLNDLDHWEALADTVLDGPPGCWEIVGKASWNWDAGRWGGSKGDQVFVARMIDGIWQDFRIEALGEVQRERRGKETRVYVEESARFAPLVGRLDGYRPEVEDDRPELNLPDREPTARERAQEERRERRRERRRSEEDGTEGPRNVLNRALDRLSGSVVSSWAQWDGDQDSVVLYRQIPMGETNLDAEQTVRFPGGGAPVALDVMFPDRFMVGDGFPRVTVREAEVHVRVRPSGGALFPTMEAYKFEWSVLGFSGTGAQTIQYKSARPCPVKEADADQPAG